MPDSDSRRVNNILHTLRGEQFRHQRNVEARLKARGITPTYSSSALSFGFATLELEDSSPPQVTKTWSGPKPPKSWQNKQTDQQSADEVSARARILLVVLSRLPSVRQDAIPPLTLLCLRKIASSLSKNDFDESVAYIPPHLRCQLLHDTAIHAPLSNAKLYALLTPDSNHIDGELFVIGPTQTLPNDFFMRQESKDRESAESLEWDNEDLEWAPQPFHTLVLASTHLSTSTFLTLPHTLTHLGLINLTVALPLHRLPNICPMLVVLDLSYNTWLHYSHKDAERTLDRVAWSRWKGLEVLGMRECRLDATLIGKINQGRWDDVQIIQ